MKKKKKIKKKKSNRKEKKKKNKKERFSFCVDIFSIKLYISFNSLSIIIIFINTFNSNFLL
jgi:uncharacterized membrane protein (DUF485 family)